MEPILSNRYSPPGIRYTAQRLAFFSGCLSATVTYFWNKRYRQWRHLSLSVAPFWTLALGLGQWRPLRSISLPQGYVFQKHEGTSGTVEREGLTGACHSLAYGLTRPLAKSALYQGLSPCHFPNHVHRKAREEVARLLGFEFVKYESFQERGQDQTLLLDGIRRRASGFTDCIKELADKEDLQAFINQTVHGEELQKATCSLLQEHLAGFKTIQSQMEELNIHSESKGDVALLFVPFAGYSRYMMTDAFAYLAAGYDVMLTDLRGFGFSEGTPCAEGTRLDTEAMVESAFSWGAQGIVSHGRCMGGFHALYATNYAQGKGRLVKGCIIDRYVSLPSRVLSQEGMEVPDQVVGAILGGLGDYVYPYDSGAEIGKEGFSSVPFGMIRGTKDMFVNPLRITNESEEQGKDAHVGIALKALGQEGNPKEYVLDLPINHGDDWWEDKSHCGKTLQFIFKKKIGA
ncbi:MAG: alpha/beta hydrolase [Verrucomicrobia bacterium]|nr:alpha/beta hydrolase [Verrucomicrobiota bacterium]